MKKKIHRWIAWSSESLGDFEEGHKATQPDLSSCLYSVGVWFQNVEYRMVHFGK